MSSTNSWRKEGRREKREGEGDRLTLTQPLEREGGRQTHRNAMQHYLEWPEVGRMDYGLAGAHDSPEGQGRGRWPEVCSKAKPSPHLNVQLWDLWLTLFIHHGLLILSSRTILYILTYLKPRIPPYLPSLTPVLGDPRPPTSYIRHCS